MVPIDEWMKEYEVQLTKVVSEDKEKPTKDQQYVYGVAMVPTVCAKMRLAFERGSFNKDGEAIKRTCKAFHIKHTYAAIKDFLNGIGGK